MKIISKKNTLLTALARIQGIVEKSSIKPLTSNALIDATKNGISVSATNLQIGMKATYSDVTVVEEGKISVNARKLYEIVKELPEKEISLTEKENYWIKICCGKDVNFNIIGLPPEDFPQLFKEEQEEYIEWETEKLINMLDLTSFSISKDETKLNICGAYIENLENRFTRIVTTDGYRLSIVDEDIGKEAPLEEGFIIPYKGILEIHRILLEKKEEKKLAVLIDKNSIVIKIGEIELFIRLLEKKFPDYKVIIPGDGYKKEDVKIENKIIKPALKRMSIISQENNRPVIFSFKEQNLEIFTEDSELGNVKEIIAIGEKIKEEISFCINSMYLLDVLNAVDDDIVLEYNLEEENKPIVVRALNRKEEMKYIIMPMIMD